jgi:Fe-S cluster biosynthesis and repair protein YggX
MANGGIEISAMTAKAAIEISANGERKKKWPEWRNQKCININEKRKKMQSMTNGAKPMAKANAARRIRRSKSKSNQCQ